MGMEHNSTREELWYVSIFEAFLLEDCPRLLEISPTVFAADVHTLRRRLATEGESFVTKTLPKFGKAFDLALQGAQPLTVTAFRKRRKTSALPAFLQGLTRLVFSESGWVLDEPSLVAIRLTRQLLFWCKKLEKGFTDESIRKAVQDVIDVDSLLPVEGEIPTTGVLGCAKAVIELIFGYKPRVTHLRPKHGPGSVAYKLGEDTVLDKRLSRVRYSALERAFRPIPFFFSLSQAATNFSQITDRIGCEYGLSRLEFVEKDSSGPRVIGLEPAEYMWCQQALKTWMYTHIESHPLVKGQINFTDQSINRDLVSRWDLIDTLDMSKASDRNSLALVKALFEKTWLWPYLLASRTPGTVLPDGRVLWFKKFAPMGSAVCFPVEACVFYALAVAVLHILRGFPLLIALRNVYVYGDDIIVPHGHFEQLNQVFETFGLKFNPDKCCIHGKFRESCGRDAFDGVDVTPVRFRHAYLKKRYFPSLVPLIKHVNSLFLADYRGSAMALRKAAFLYIGSRAHVGKRDEKALKAKWRKILMQIPSHHRQDLPILSWVVDPADSGAIIKYDRKRQSFFVRGLHFKPSTVWSDPALSEEHLLLESLARNGPVGRTITTPKMGKVRIFDEPKKGALVWKKFFLSSFDERVNSPPSVEDVLKWDRWRLVSNNRS